MNKEKKLTGNHKISLKRILAIIALLVIVLCIAWLLFNTFSGGSVGTTLALLFCLMVIPSIIFIFIKFAFRTTDSDTPSG